MFIIGGVLGGIAGVCLVGIIHEPLGTSWAAGLVQAVIVIVCCFLGCVLFEILEDVITERRRSGKE